MTILEQCKYTDEKLGGGEAIIAARLSVLFLWKGLFYILVQRI